MINSSAIFRDVNGARARRRAIAGTAALGLALGLAVPGLPRAAPDDPGADGAARAALSAPAARGLLEAARTNDALRAAVSRALGRLRARAGLPAAAAPGDEAAALASAASEASAVAGAVPLEPVLAALADPDPSLQALAAELLAESGDARAVAALEPLRQAKDPRVRDSAARALEQSRRPRSDSAPESGAPAPSAAAAREPPAKPVPPAAARPAPRADVRYPGARTAGAAVQPVAETARERGWGGWLFWTILWLAGLAAVLYLVGAMAGYVFRGETVKAMGAVARLVALVWLLGGCVLLRLGQGPVRAAALVCFGLAWVVAWLARSFFRAGPALKPESVHDYPLTRR